MKKPRPSDECSWPPMREYEERERKLKAVCEKLSDMELLLFATWEIHAVTEDTSDVVSEELLKRSGIEEGLAKW